MAFAATVCPITRQEFHEHARDLPVTINGLTLTAEPKQFSTNGLGWNISAKEHLDINGKRVKVQIGLNISIIGSKELP
jgi:hypothetical protein